MKRITVFCGSSKGYDPVYIDRAHELGTLLAKLNYEVVYGGTRIGLMGALADGALQKEGKVTGVLPRFLKEKEIAHEELSELILVDTMHERKVKMRELSDAAIALPGGFGTMEEFFEMLTWGQLGIHKKPVGMLNINGFYDKLDQFLDDMVKQGFLNAENKQMVLFSSSSEELISLLESYEPPDVEKWIREKIQ